MINNIDIFFLSFASFLSFLLFNHFQPFSGQNRATNTTNITIYGHFWGKQGTTSHNSVAFTYIYGSNLYIYGDLRIGLGQKGTFQ